MTTFVEWLEGTVVDRRAPADPFWVSRALRLSAGSIGRVQPEPIKRLFQARLSQIPFIEEAVSRDPSVRDELAIPLEPVRFITHDSVVSEKEFVEAIVAALQGHDACVSDRQKRKYDVTLTKSRDQIGVFETIAFVRGDERFVDASRMLPLLVADLDILTSQLVHLARYCISLNARRGTLQDRWSTYPPATDLRCSISSSASPLCGSTKSCVYV